MMGARLEKDTLEQITGWLRRLWPEAEVWGWAVEELLQQVFCEYSSPSGYMERVAAAVPEMAGRLESLEQVLDDEHGLCHIWQVTWGLGRDVGDHQIVES